MDGRWPFRFSGGFVLSYRWFALGIGVGSYVWLWFRFILSLVRVRVSLYVMFGGGFVLSYRWCALDVGFGRSDFAGVSSYHIVGRVRLRFWTLS